MAGRQDGGDPYSRYQPQAPNSAGGGVFWCLVFAILLAFCTFQAGHYTGKQDGKVEVCRATCHELAFPFYLLTPERTCDCWGDYQDTGVKADEH